eukprot:12123068-Alexandrium_andersonii.AAC.1
MHGRALIALRTAKQVRWVASSTKPVAGAWGTELLRQWEACRERVGAFHEAAEAFGSVDPERSQ